MRLIATTLLILGAATSGYAVALNLAGKPAFDPRSFRGTQEGPLTQVLTLGSPHLAQLPQKPASAALEPVLDKLAAFKPQIITHEGLSGEQCDQVARYKTRYPSIWDDYCYDTAAVEQLTGLTVPAAMEKIETTLGSWPALPSAADRRQLAMLFLAANDRSSALVQWLRLAPAERRIGDGLDQPLVTLLNEWGKKPNETIAIGVALAVRLGLDRIYAVDDHTADSIASQAGAGYGPAIQAHWSSDEPAPPKILQYKAVVEKLSSTGDYLAFYRLLNQPETQRQFIEYDYGRALMIKGANLYGRQYVAWFEARNLRMVANIRATFGNRPGARVLNIVGASHKGYYDAYLDMMSDVQIIDAEKVLN